MNKITVLAFIVMILFCSCKPNNSVSEGLKASDKSSFSEKAIDLIENKYNHLEETGCIGLIYGLCDITQDGAPEFFCSLVSASKCLTYHVYSLDSQSELLNYFADYSSDEIFGDETSELLGSVYYTDKNSQYYYVSQGLVSSTEIIAQNDVVYYKILKTADGFEVNESDAYNSDDIDTSIVFNPFDENAEPIFLYNCTIRYIPDNGYYIHNEAVESIIQLLEKYYSGLDNSIEN